MHKKTVMSLMEKNMILTSFVQAWVCAFNANESTIWYIKKKEEDICQSIHDATPESVKVTPTAWDKAMQNLKKWLILWIWEMTTKTTY